MPAARRTIRALYLAGGATFAALAILVTGLVATQFASARAQAEIEAHRRAQVVATQFSWLFEVGAQSLQRIDETLGQAPLANGPTVSDLGAAVRSLPAGLLYSVYDRNGRLVLSSSMQGETVNIADRDYFQMLRAGEERAISPMLTDRRTGQKSFIIGKRLDGPDGFAGIATIAIRESLLLDMAAVLGVAGESTIGLVGTDGQLIARLPWIPPVNIAGSAMFREMVKQHDGSYRSVSPLDGKARIVGYWRMDDWPLVAFAGLSVQTVAAPVWRQLAVGAAMLGPVILLCLWMVWRLLMQVRLDARRYEELTASRDLNRTLLHEMHHRVKNNLQTVMSLIRLGARQDQQNSTLLGRIGAMAAVHEEMYGTDKFANVDMAVFLDRLIRNIAKGFGIPAKLVIDLDPLSMSGDRATQLALLTNELVSNSFRHAMIPRGGGRLSATLKVQEPGWARLTIADDGPGYDPLLTEPGMGSRLIVAFAEQLGARLNSTHVGGLVTTLDFPTTCAAEAAQPADGSPVPQQSAT